MVAKVRAARDALISSAYNVRQIEWELNARHCAAPRANMSPAAMAGS